MTPKFRARKLDGGDWVVGSYDNTAPGKEHIHDVNPYRGHPVDPATLQQQIAGKWLTMEQVGGLLNCGNCIEFGRLSDACCASEGGGYEDCEMDGSERCDSWKPRGQK